MTSSDADTDTGDAWALSPIARGELVAFKYVVEDVIGVGGMGIVVGARDTVLERRVAIKFLLPRLASSEIGVQRFVREARVSASITSEHAVRLLEIDKLPNGIPYFVMERLEGSDLRQVLRREGYLAPKRAADYVLQALQAIAEGHRKRIVHRDLKPSNLFLTTRIDGSPLIKVLDFGIAKWAQSSSIQVTNITESGGALLGSPAYMPPEQLRDAKQADERSDIWSIGATLYELLTGSPPFRAPAYADLVSQILNEPVEPASSRRRDLGIPAKLSGLVAKCLEKVPVERFGDSAQLAAALVPFASEDGKLSFDRIRGLSKSSPQPARQAEPDVPADPGCTTTQLLTSTGPDSNSQLRRGRTPLGFAIGGLAATLGIGGSVWLSTSALRPASESSPKSEPTMSAESTLPTLQRQIAPALAEPPLVNGSESNGARTPRPDATKPAIPAPDGTNAAPASSSAAPPSRRPQGGLTKAPRSESSTNGGANPPAAKRPDIEELIKGRY